MNTVQEVICIKDLRKEYPGGGGVHGLDLRIEEGTALGLLGPNGAGKSTTLKMLMGLIQPSSGNISILGHDISTDSESVRRKVGYVPEHQHMYPWMTVAQLLRFVRAFYPTWDNNICTTLLKDYGLSATKKVKELSNGMQTKLALVLALSHNPALLILDEPTSGLDPLVREEFLEKVHKLVQGSRHTVLFSSHIMSDVEEIADRVAIVESGKILVVAHRNDLMKKTRQISVSLVQSNKIPVAPQGTIYQNVIDDHWNLTVFGFTEDTLDRIRGENDIVDLEVKKPSLENIFKDFVKGARMQ